MKTILLETLTGLLLLAAIFQTTFSNIFPAEKAMDKQISFSIARDSNYNGQAYDMELATVHVIIFKVKAKKQIVLWQKVFDTMQLKMYPTTAKALCQTVTVKNIYDSKEKLFVTYIVTYNTKGSIIQLENGTCVTKNAKEEKLCINI